MVATDDLVKFNQFQTFQKVYVQKSQNAKISKIKLPQNRYPV